ncbi:hypothetical protein [Absidia glauca]|uniref:Mediator of RNA polymerase II transcription subunit 4 n=1 Tax=Absidia glauca TaxID=4829 RepID=A0A168PLM8_ABSGL|nr:hypothetical protein [Absidia glauca]
MTSSLRDQVNDLLTEYTLVSQRYFQSLIQVAEDTPLDPQQSPEFYIQEMVKVDTQLQFALDQSKHEKITLPHPVLTFVNLLFTTLSLSLSLFTTLSLSLSLFTTLSLSLSLFPPVGEHQARQQQIIKVQDDIQDHQATLLSMVEQLNIANQDLEQTLNGAKKELQAADYAKKANIQFTDVLSYASKLSKYTSAPPNFDLMNRDIKVYFEKPYPDEERIRRGLLYWQHSSQPIPEDKFESSDNESMSDENSDTKKDEPASTEEDGPAPFWLLDLNP